MDEQRDALLAHSRRARWEKERGILGLPQAQDGLVVLRNLDTSALAAPIPLLDNANQVEIAPAGAGKSFYCKLLSLRQLINGTACIAIDPEAEYWSLADAVGGQVVRLASSVPTVLESAQRRVAVARAAAGRSARLARSSTTGVDSVEVVPAQPARQVTTGITARGLPAEHRDTVKWMRRVRAPPMLER